MPADLPPALLWGLRRYLAAPAATATSLQRQPFSGGLSGSTLAYWRLNLRRAGVQANITLIHKRGAVVEGAFMRGAPQREASIYANLAGKTPITLPTPIAFDLLSGDLWLLPFPPAKHTSHWLADWDRADVENALGDLARLHAAYVQADILIAAEGGLASWSWLARPTTTDVPDLMADTRRSLETLLDAGIHDDMLNRQRLVSLLTLASSPEPLLNLLNRGPSTLLHGDAGFQNIAISLDGRERVWYDWQLAALGPPALDLVTFLQPWAYPEARPPLSLDNMTDVYLAALARRGCVIDPDQFACQLDAALLWRWLCQWAPLLGLYRSRLRPDVRQRLYHAFAQLQWPALDRWDKGVLTG